ncbi:MAG: queuine tRNA-ribosyltransferase family protein [Thermoplasmata archaeon]|nr:queuine tRNA-ribosyltransferase family protein [Thermoplasmata archaeon]
MLRLLLESRYPRALLSAYDCLKRMKGGITAATSLVGGLQKGGCVVILDSGGFESQVLGDPGWSLEDYDAVSKSVPFDFLMSFDSQLIGKESAKNSGNSESSDASEPRKGTTIQIVHGRNRDFILEEVRNLIAKRSIDGVAVPDRECGPDLLARVRTVTEIRRLLDTSDEGSMLHILGCGNPVVMGALVSAGADSFDSLDWTQGAVDIRSLTFTDPVLLKRTGCLCAICTSLPGSDIELALLHNLLFYQHFAKQLREMIRNHTIPDFLQEFTGKEFTRKILEIIAVKPAR